MHSGVGLPGPGTGPLALVDRCKFPGAKIVLILVHIVLRGLPSPLSIAS